MLWLYLLGAITVLCIALRRVIHRQTPLSDEVYSTKVAFDHLQSGVAWVRGDGTLGMVNSSLVATLGSEPKALIGRDWLDIFPPMERKRVQESYSRMLLLGRTDINTHGQRADGVRNGKWRQHMSPEHLKERGYGQRWAVESFFSGLKRTMGDALAARRPQQMLAEAAFKVLAYTLRR